MNAAFGFGFCPRVHALGFASADQANRSEEGSKDDDSGTVAEQRDTAWWAPAERRKDGALP